MRNIRQNLFFALVYNAAGVPVAAGVLADPLLLVDNNLRIDESLFFANARAIEDVVQQAVAERPQVRHVVLNCAAVNGIDASALESLELIMHRLGDAGIKLHLSEVKGR